MKTRKKKSSSGIYVFTVVLIVIISIIGAYILIQKQDLEQAPDFMLTDTDGNTFNLSDFKGKVVVLDLMATWCGSCQKVEKELQKVYKYYQKENQEINNSIPIQWFNSSGTLLGSDIGSELVEGITFEDFPFNVENNATKVEIELQGEGRPGQDLDLQIFDSEGNSIANSENPGDHEEIVLEYNILKNLSIGEFRARVTNWGGGPNNFDITIGVYYENNLNNSSNFDNSDVIIISIDVDPNESEETLREYKEEHNIPWIMAKDTDDVMKKYSAYEIAKIIIIDKDGNAIFSKVGITKTSEMKRSINNALEGEATAISVVSVGIIGFAFLAGIFSFFSPCSFPLLPGYMSYYLVKDESKNGKLSSNTAKRALIPGVSAALGILVVYLIVGIVVVIFSSSIKPLIPKLGPMVGIIFLILGLIMLTNIQYNFITNPIMNFSNRITARITDLTKSKNLIEKVYKKESSGFFAYGVGYGSASAGCTAPIFIAIIFSAMEYGEDIGIGVEMGVFLVFLVYALTMAVLMVIITILVAASKETIIQKLKISTPYLKKFSGIMFVIVGIYLVWFYYSSFY